MKAAYKIPLILLALLMLCTQAHAQKSALLWGTYFGGDTTTANNGIVTDNSGNVYITGYTYNTKQIATKGAYQTKGDSINGDAFLAKFSSSGNLLWATYFGGGGEENGVGIAIDKSNNIYITGNTTSSSDIATSNAYQTSFAGGGPNGDAFLAKFSSSGNLLWATYFGGNGDDQGIGIAIDTSGKIYISGLTESKSGIATSGAYQTSYGGGDYDAFLAKFNSSGNLLWATYFGGDNYDDCYGVATDAFDNAYITGTTLSTTHIATSGAYQTSGDSINGVVFLTKFNSSGNLLWATYYGDSSGGGGVATDKSGKIYITGLTSGTSNIATSGAYQTSYGGGVYDAFLAKFSQSGNLLWATYFGGSGDDEGVEVAIDTAGSIHTSGWTTSTSGISTSGAYQTFHAGGGYNTYLAKFSSQGSLLWSSYFGGSGGDNYGGTLAIDIFNNVYIDGLTSSTSGITTSGAYQFSYGGYGNGFLAKFKIPTYYNDAGIDFVLRLSPTEIFCAGSIPVKAQLKNFGIDTLKSVKINWTVNSKLQPVFTWTGSLKMDSSTPVNLGNYNFNAGIDTIVAWTSSPNGTTDSFPWNDTASIIDTVNALPNTIAGNNKFVCFGNSTQIGGAAVSGNTYSWLSKPKGYTSTVSNPVVNPSATTTYYLTATTAQGCSKSDSVIISVKPLPSTPIVSLSVDTFSSSAKTGNQWLRNDTVINGASSQKYTVTASGNYSVMVTDTDGCSATSASVNYTISGIEEEVEIFHINIYPNPSSSAFTVQFQNANNNEVEISLSDIMGRQIASFSASDKNDIIINPTNYGMKSGIYILCICSGNSIYIGKLIVQ